MYITFIDKVIAHLIENSKCKNIFICTGKSQNVFDSLHCSIRFIVIVASLRYSLPCSGHSHDLSEVCLYLLTFGETDRLCEDNTSAPKYLNPHTLYSMIKFEKNCTLGMDSEDTL